MIKVKGLKEFDSSLPSISVLIPAYNCEKYIEKALKSIFVQTYAGRIEIIIGYDTKSTDRGLEIIKNLDSSYDIIVDCDNDSSTGVCRNRIFKLATGDFVLFMDSDDFIVDTLFQNVIEVFDKNSELNVVAYRCKTIVETKAEKFYNSKCGVINPKFEIMKSIDVMYSWRLSGKCAIAMWGYIYKREFLEENKIVFPDYSYGDDNIFVLKSMLKTNDVGFINMFGYIFIIHNTSLVHSKKTKEQYWDKYINFRNDYYELVSENYPIFYNINFLSLINYYIYLCADFNYDVFLKKLNDKNIKYIPIIYGKSLSAFCGSLIFNISKRLYWFIARIKRKIFKE